ncbi:MAG: type II toxin-antitoxin system Phd/YefM family antitoxin [Bifidobacteriaceae bacterium]|jgi:antitoxin (DNA-binding transcriptional repressor) of toxin-antitoxin stability system|nr:type II toxin-antitoxin system Phd/YefM family antitoxin [Bifidobacteriaceae bacterium]
MRALGVREFRTQIASLIDAGEAVEVTRHGDAVAVFLPTASSGPRSPERFLLAAQALDGQLADLGIDPDDLVAEFEQARRPGR